LGLFAYLVATFYTGFHAGHFFTALRQNREKNIAKADGIDLSQLEHVEICDFNSINFTFALLKFAIVFIVNLCKKQTLLKSILVCYFMLYLLWAGLLSNTRENCNDYKDKFGSKLLQIILHNFAFVFTFMSLHLKISICEKIA